jgi:hypothetical protein
MGSAEFEISPRTENGIKSNIKFSVPFEKVGV